MMPGADHKGVETYALVQVKFGYDTTIVALRYP